MGQCKYFLPIQLIAPANCRNRKNRRVANSDAGLLVKIGNNGRNVGGEQKATKKPLTFDLWK